MFFYAKSKNCLLLGIAFLALSSTTAATPPPQATNPPDDGMAMLNSIFHRQWLPKWRFLGVDTDQYGRQSLIFFGADTIREVTQTSVRLASTDVVIAVTELHRGQETDSLISAVQSGQYPPGSVMFAHVFCDSQSVDGWKVQMFTTQIEEYVCSHRPGGSRKPRRS